MQEEKKNFLYNVIYQLLIYIFPLITTPYISRVLGVDNIGKYSYVYSIVYIFMLISMLGINNYGNREISKVRDDKGELSSTFCSIYYLQLLVQLLVIAAYIIFSIFFVKEYNNIFYIQFIFIVSVLFDVNWFFFGIEKFKLTVTRNLLIKIFSTMLIFVFVKKSDDLWLYTLIMSLATLFSQLYLYLQLHKYIHFKKIPLKKVLSNLKSCLILFVPVLAYGIYRVMDKTMIGYFSIKELGYYENAEKLINIPISVITALGTVMLPHMAYTLKNNKSTYKDKIYDSMKLATLLSVAMAFGLFLISNDIAIIMFGREFAKSGTIIKLLSITIIFSAWACVIRTQYLIPIGEDKVYVISTVGGAIINLILNLILIRKYGAYGACVGTIFAEFFVMIYQTIKSRDKLEIDKYLKNLIKYILKIGSICIIMYIITFRIPSLYVRVSIQIIGTIALFIIIFKDYLLYEFIGKKEKDKII